MNAKWETYLNNQVNLYIKVMMIITNVLKIDETKTDSVNSCGLDILANTFSDPL